MLLVVIALNLQITATYSAPCFDFFIPPDDKITTEQGLVTTEQALTVNPSPSTSSYIEPPPRIEPVFDSENSGLPLNLLEHINDSASAAYAVNVAVAAMSSELKESPEARSTLTSFMEEAAAMAASRNSQMGDLVVSEITAVTMSSDADAAIKAVVKVASSAEIELDREMKKVLKFKTESDVVDITLEPSLLRINADIVKVQAPSFTISIPKSFIEANASYTSFLIHAEPVESELKLISASNLNLNRFLAAAASGKETAVEVEFSKKPVDSITLGLVYTQKTDGVPVIAEGSEVLASKRNSITQTIDAKISGEGTYKVKSSIKSFSDMKNKSASMQEAVNYLASNGIVSGTSQANFSPDMPISRAEIAMLLTKTIGYYNESADGHFLDVFKTDWFFGAAGSAKQKGIMVGTNPEGTLFSPKMNIPKIQIASIFARILQTEMRYIVVSDAETEKTLSIFSDRNSIPDWAAKDIALVLRQNILKGSYSFSGDKELSRGEVAEMLHVLYLRIWE
jgi:hypothetical protein